MASWVNPDPVRRTGPGSTTYRDPLDSHARNGVDDPPNDSGTGLLSLEYNDFTGEKRSRTHASIKIPQHPAL